MMMKALAGLWRRTPVVADRPALREFLSGEAAFLAQKTTVEYCRARSGLLWQKLFSEEEFRGALDRCRWGAMAAVLADQLIVAEGLLRAHAGGREAALGAALAALYQDILTGYSAAEPDRHVGWDDLAAEFPARISRAQLGPPHAPDQIAKTAGNRVYDLLPIHKSLRGHDREMMVNAIRFGMVAFQERLVQAVRDPALLARNLIAETTPGA